MTAWEKIQVLLLFVLVPVLLALLGLLLIRAMRPLAARSVLVRLLSRLLGIAMITIVVFMVLWITLVVLFEVFGERAVVPWLPLGAPAVTGVGFYAWGRFAWRFKREALIGPRCRKCRYDLTGLDLAATPPPPCPECGRVAASRKELFRVPTRKWAMRLGVLLIAGGLIVPPAVRVYREGWLAQVPDWVLLRMLVSDVHADAALQRLWQRSVTLAQVDPHWTRDLMVSFADEYDAAAAGGKTPPWMIYNRFYPLYQPATDAETVALAYEWCKSPSVGRRTTATGMMSVQGFAPAADRLHLLRPLLSDPDPGVRVHALRALTKDAALPLDELLAIARDPASRPISSELNAALSRYAEPQAQRTRLAMAADSSDAWADMITWGLLHGQIDFNSGKPVPGGLKMLAQANVVPPTARTAWFRGREFDHVYRALIESAVSAPGSDGEDAATAAWCRAALISYATTPPSTLPGAPASLRPAMLFVLDARIGAERDNAIKGRLVALRNEISPGDAPADGGERGGSTGDK